MHTRVSKSLSPPLLSPYMEAISLLHCWLLRIFLFPPVLIRMSAGSVTCNLSARPQQLHRHGEHSHNDIVLDWGRVSGGDRWCRFSSPVPPPLFPSRRSETRHVQLSPGCFTSWALQPRSRCYSSRVCFTNDDFLTHSLCNQSLTVERLSNSLCRKPLSHIRIYIWNRWNIHVCLARDHLLCTICVLESL